jgi:hypothetical protein
MNEVITAIQTLLSTTLTTTYKKYYYGEVKVPNQAFMPFVEIFGRETNLDNK